jgi:hypothetical protein
MKKKCLWMLAAILVCGASVFTSCTSNADNPINSHLTLQKDSVLLASGQTITIVPKSINHNGQYTFESSDKNVAIVDDKGVVTGVSAGLATIKVMLAADHYYQEGTALFKVKVYGSLTGATEHEIGMLMCQDGHIHEDGDATCRKPRVAMLAYVGNKSNCAHGLAIALWDAGNGDWEKAVSGAETWSNDYPVAGGTWRLPSTDDWQYMFIGCGGTTPYISKLTQGVKVDAQGLINKLSAAGYSAPSTNYYWSSTENSKDKAKAWEFVTNKFYNFTKTYEDCIRYCIAF